MSPKKVLLLKRLLMRFERIVERIKRIWGMWKIGANSWGLLTKNLEGRLRDYDHKGNLYSILMDYEKSKKNIKRKVIWSGTLGMKKE